MGGGIIQQSAQDADTCMPDVPVEGDVVVVEDTTQALRRVVKKEVRFRSEEPSFANDFQLSGKSSSADDIQQLGVVVDRSGSMASMRSELVEGLNLFMEEQRKVGPAKVTVLQFDNKVESVLDSIDLDQVPKFGQEHFQPRGMTALLDAIGAMIETMEARVPSGTLEGSAAPVIVILTDGQENASQNFSRKRIFDTITQKKALGWKVTFMGANQDAIAVGESFGLDRGSCVTYAASGEKQNAVWQATSAKVSRERFSSCQSSYSPDERFRCG
jgi:Mg-chelatase subunit ChlD